MEKYKALTMLTASVMSDTDTLFDKAELLTMCGTYLGYDETGDKVISANFCRERFCPMCQKRKSLKQYANSLRLAEFLQGEFVFLHCVLTVQNCFDIELNETINNLYSASRKFFNNKRIRQGFKGALRALEVTYNQKRDDYHPHLHCLVAVRRSYFTSRYYISIDTLRQIWADCLGVDYLPQVHISKCDENGFAEISKYCVKPLDLQLPRHVHAKVLDTLNRALKGRRLLQSYGVIREAAATLKLNEDIETPNECSVCADDVKVYKYNFSLGKYEI
jgi:hypothetical protein